MSGTAALYAAKAREPAWRFLAHVNPLAKLAASFVVLIALLFVRGFAVPIAFIALSYLMLLVGTRPTRRLCAMLFLALPVVAVLIGVGFSLWTDPARVDPGGSAVVEIGAWRLLDTQLRAGFATAVRLWALFSVALIAGAGTSGPELVRSAVQNLRLPYRIGYTALAAYRFVPRFRRELEIIRAAHRVRGHHNGRGPFAAIARAAGYVVPLLAGGIRHAERVALSMDARAFGAHPTRTERDGAPLRIRDAVFLVLFLAVCAGILIAGSLLA